MSKRLVVCAALFSALAVFTFPTGSLGSYRPSDVMHENEIMPRLVIETSKHTLTLHLADKEPVVVRAQGAYGLKPGVYSITAKQTDPVWYAPPSYFLRRGQPVPTEGSKMRYIRALGKQAFFIDKQAAIHSGPLWSDDLGGVKLAPRDMAKLFEHVRVGATIEVL